MNHEELRRILKSTDQCFVFYIQAKFEFDYLDYEKQLLRLISRKEHNGLVINNSSQSLFLFVDKHLLQVQQFNM